MKGNPFVIRNKRLLTFFIGCVAVDFGMLWPRLCINDSFSWTGHVCLLLAIKKKEKKSWIASTYVNVCFSFVFSLLLLARFDRIIGNTWGAPLDVWCCTILQTKRNWAFWVSPTRCRSIPMVKMGQWFVWVVPEVVNKWLRPSPSSSRCRRAAQLQLVPSRNPVWLAPWPKRSRYVKFESD